MVSGSLLAVLVIGLIIQRRIRMSKIKITPADALSLLALIQLKPLTDAERQTFQGCEGKHPTIGYVNYDGANLTLLVDGTQLLIVQEGQTDGGTQFNLERL